MGPVKEINVKNRSYYFFDDMINLENVDLNLLKIDKKSYGIDIHYIRYITIKKSGDCENIHSVNPFYLIIHSATRCFKEKKRRKILSS